MKRGKVVAKAPVVHKGTVTSHGIYNFCDDTMRDCFSTAWDKVTCWLCLKKRGERKR